MKKVLGLMFSVVLLANSSLAQGFNFDFKFDEKPNEAKSEIASWFESEKSTQREEEQRSESSKNELTPNDELIFAVKGAARGAAMLGAMILPMPGILLAAGVDPDESNADLVKIDNILNKGANINHQDPWGYTALIYAAYYGYPQIAQHLLNRGASKHITEKKGYNALSMAQYYVDDYKKLASMNTDPKMVDHYNQKIARYEQTVQVLR